MPDYFRLAGDAIEMVVKQLHPADLNTWPTKTPMSNQNGWGMSPANWNTAGRRMQNEFNRLISPRHLDIKVPAMKALGGRPLSEYQQYMAMRAGMELV